jgi:hypothetical protein
MGVLAIIPILFSSGAAPQAPFTAAPASEGPSGSPHMGHRPPDTAAANAPRTIAPYFVPATSSPKPPDLDGFLQRWLLLEPISKPNRSNTVFTDSYVLRQSPPQPTRTRTNYPEERQSTEQSGLDYAGYSPAAAVTSRAASNRRSSPVRC